MIIIKSQQAVDQIIANNNHIWEKKRTTRDSVRRRCINRTCKASATSCLDYQQNLSSFEVLWLHNHPADVDLAIRKPIIEKMKKRIVETSESPRVVLYATIRGADERVICALGSFDNILRLLRYAREKSLNPGPYENQTLKLSRLLLITHLNERFYQYGPEAYGMRSVNPNLIIFYSNGALNNLGKNLFWAVDGTFSVVPEPYYQLYTISYIKGHHVFPSVFAILKNKSFETYKSLFEIIKEELGGVVPDSVKTDFEYAAIAALRNVFTGVQISGCLFHLAQAIDRKIKVSGLSSLYSCNSDVRKYTMALRSLAFVDFDSVLDTFLALRSSAEFPRALLDLYSYFYDTYLDLHSRFPQEVWHSMNVIDRDFPRTNNAIEGWHNVFSNTFGTCRYSFYLLISKLKDEEDAIRIRAFLQDTLNVTFERKKKYVDRENSLYTFLMANRHRNNEIDYVFEISKILNS